MNLKFLLSLILILTGLAQLAFSQVTYPDPGFGINGAVKTDLNGNNDVAVDLSVLNNGKIIVCGSAVVQSHKEFALTRYLPDGTIDSTFGIYGKAYAGNPSLNNFAKAMSIQQDGKILVAGNYDNNFYNDPMIVRFKSNGTIDSTFGTAGTVKFILSNQFDEFNDIALQPDGKIIVAGRTFQNNVYNFLVMRLLSDGTPDSTFDADGKVITNINASSYDCIQSLIIQNDGKILVSGYSSTGAYYFAAARYHSNGTLDNSFSGDGKISIASGSRVDMCYGMALTQDSSIILAGTHHNNTLDEYMIVKLDKYGVPVNTFGTNGTQLLSTTNANDILTDVAIQPNGKILISGSGAGQKAIVLRLTSDGTPDNTFGNNGFYAGNTGGTSALLNGMTVLSDSVFFACGSVNNGTFDDFLIVKNGLSSATGLNSVLHNKTDLILYPNPATDFITLKTAKNFDQSCTLNIYDQRGAIVLHETEIFIYNELTISLNGRFNSGLYFLEIIGNQESYTQKFFVK